jgi:hypothetical protein
LVAIPYNTDVGRAIALAGMIGGFRLGCRLLKRRRSRLDGRITMLAFCPGPTEVALVLERSDARWLSEEMSFLSELYRSKAASSERQFGRDDNPASASFWETALKCQRVCVALQAAVNRGYHPDDDGRDRQVDPSTATHRPHPVLVSPGPAMSSGSAKRNKRPNRARRTTKGRKAKKKG